MSDGKDKIKTIIKDRAINIKRKMQHETLLQWDRGFVTARQCIEKIIELEKLIHIDTKLLRGLKNGR